MSSSKEGDFRDLKLSLVVGVSLKKSARWDLIRMLDVSLGVRKIHSFSKRLRGGSVQDKDSVCLR